MKALFCFSTWNPEWIRDAGKERKTSPQKSPVKWPSSNFPRYGWSWYIWKVRSGTISLWYYLNYGFEAGMFSFLRPESWEGGILHCNRVGFFPSINNGQYSQFVGCCILHVYYLCMFFFAEVIWRDNMWMNDTLNVYYQDMSWCHSPVTLFSTSETPHITGAKLIKAGALAKSFLSNLPWREPHSCQMTKESYDLTVLTKRELRSNLGRFVAYQLHTEKYEKENRITHRCLLHAGRADLIATRWQNSRECGVMHCSIAPFKSDIPIL